MEKFILEKKFLWAEGSGERSSIGLSGQLQKIGFTLGRMKTGTPPRIDGRSIDYSKMEEDNGDSITKNFSYLNEYTIKSKNLASFVIQTKGFMTC